MCVILGAATTSRSLRPVSRELPSVDLVVATVGRSDELGSFLDSVEAQGYERLRVIVVDQNEDERVTEIVHGRGLELVHARSPRGLSRARNAGLEHVEAELVAFPDDDCVYPPGLLDRIAERFGDPGLDGLTGRGEDVDGRSSTSWKTDRATLTDDNLWNRAISFTIFLRREVVQRVGAFDERLGLGSPDPWSSGEEIDYLIRAVRGGARVEYDPSLVVRHPVRGDDARVGTRDGASVGYLLRKHRYPAQVVARMLVRPVGGVLTSLTRLDGSRARYHLATLAGRVRGYRGTKREKTSA
jgi:glycosyltransferase involved in cell wall biosynthesis